MKKVLLIALLICTKQVKAQGYQKLLADSVTEFDVIWDGPMMRLSNPHQTLSTCGYYDGIYYAKTDSLYKGKVYKKVSNNNFYPPFQGLLREDTTLRRVYFIPYCDTTEALLYNFSLLQGDTISYTFPNAYSTVINGVFTVDSIRLKHDYRNYYHKHFYLRNHASTYTFILEIIEGVGSSYHPLFLYGDFWQGTLWGCTSTTFDEVVVCKWNNGSKVYYDSCAYSSALYSGCYNITDTCNYMNHCGGIEQHAGKEQVSIYPNPASTNLTLTLSKGEGEATIYMYDMLGNTVKQSLIYNLTSIINIADLSEGVYTISISGKDGVVNKRLVIVR